MDWYNRKTEKNSSSNSNSNSYLLWENFLVFALRPLLRLKGREPYWPAVTSTEGYDWSGSLSPSHGHASCSCSLIPPESGLTMACLLPTAENKKIWSLKNSSHLVDFDTEKNGWFTLSIFQNNNQINECWLILLWWGNNVMNAPRVMLV